MFSPSFTGMIIILFCFCFDSFRKLFCFYRGGHSCESFSGIPIRIGFTTLTASASTLRMALCRIGYLRSPPHKLREPLQRL